MPFPQLARTPHCHGGGIPVEKDDAQRIPAIVLHVGLTHQMPGKENASV